MHVIEHQLAAALELFPVFAQARVLRTWAGIVDVSPDASTKSSAWPRSRGCISTAAGEPAGSRPPPARESTLFASTIATGEPHVLNAPFSLDRFVTGALIDEHGAAAVAH